MPIDINKIPKVCEEISEDTRRDADYYEGKPFIGSNVAEYLGKQGAMISVLAQIVKTLAEHIQNNKTKVTEP